VEAGEKGWGAVLMRKLFDETEIARRVATLAGEIAGTFDGEFTIVALLKGSFVFVSDLARALDREGLEPMVEFLRLSSYGDAKQSSGRVRLVGEAPTNLAGRRILLVDDIVDTGRSILYAKDLIENLGASQIWTCALIDKPSMRQVEVAADFIGFTVGDIFVAGYGTDHAEKYRHLPYIGVVE
jgi:hypoxanthine phosphoribosyltransferase